MRTYTQVIDDGVVRFPFQAVIMLYLITDGPELTLRKIAKLSKTPVHHLYQAALITMEKGWTARTERGVYALTHEGRITWNRVLKRAFKA